MPVVLHASCPHANSPATGRIQLLNIERFINLLYSIKYVHLSAYYLSAILIMGITFMNYRTIGTFTKLIVTLASADVIYQFNYFVQLYNYRY